MPRAFLFDKHGDSTDTADGPRRCTLFTPLIRLTLSNVRKGYSAMRWQLRNQIMLPMVGVMLASLVAVSVLNAFLSVQRTCLRIEREMNEMATTLADANFPLTDGVLSKMRGLSGTEFVIIQQDGSVVASSSPNNSFFGLSESAPFVERDQGLGEPVSLESGRFFHKSLRMARGTSTGQAATLHILYPEESYLEAWRDAAYPPLVVGSVALLLVVAVAAGIASQVTRPLQRLQAQVGEIAEGDFQSIPVPLRDDEIADLSRSINRMAEMLAKYESNVRQNERLRTLGQLFAGIAHQMRNSATGCRLAVELHARQCTGRHDESLDVAKRQLELMESYLQRFLRLGRNDSTPHVETDLGDVVTSSLSLVQPMVRRARASLDKTPSG
ncbi:MAG: HAMP domain-containing protein [Planctomycetaceae bacterium]|nr:HAMP domain-containing protein [Planctomycetales bacterium]MCB9925332.1 HAMP domain-containing protein [Planctomycetaceae bacterium]